MIRLTSPPPDNCRLCPAHNYWVAGAMHMCQFKHVAMKDGELLPFTNVKESDGDVLAGWVGGAPIVPPSSCPRHFLPAKPETETPTVVPNSPSAEGVLAGKELARIFQPAIESFEAIPDMPHRCKTCAFRLGTIPNQTLPTVMDAVKCIAEKEDFFCHTDTDQLCVGYVAAAVASQNTPFVKAPWSYSHVPEVSEVSEFEQKQQQK
jgi:hypothetical protein